MIINAIFLEFVVTILQKLPKFSYIFHVPGHDYEVISQKVSTWTKYGLWIQKLYTLIIYKNLVLYGPYTHFLSYLIYQNNIYIGKLLVERKISVRPFQFENLVDGFSACLPIEMKILIFFLKKKIKKKF